MSSNVNPRQNSISRGVILNNEMESKVIEESEKNRFRTYNIKDKKMAKTYLSEDVIRDFKKGFEASSKAPSSTPKSRNFVKKLVASLESKKYESGHCTADDEFFTKCYSRPLSNNHVLSENQEKKKNYFEEKYNSKIVKLKENFEGVKKKEIDFEFPKQGAVTNLTIDEYIKLNSAKNIHVTKKNDNFEKRKNYFSFKNEGKIKTDNHSDDAESVTLRRCLHQPNNQADFSFQSDKSDNLSTIFAETKKKENIFRRSEPIEEKKSFKSFLSSLIGFKSRNSALPRGKRNMFNAKESLGEEMRVFRRDMMPALMKSAKSHKSEFEDDSKDDTFTEMLAASKPHFDNRSASIHPFYGVKRTPTFLHPLPEEHYALPEEHYAFPSESSQEKSKSPPMDRKFFPQRKQSSPIYEIPAEIIYDVPKSNKVVNMESAGKNAENSNTCQYANFLANNSWCKIVNPVPRKNIVCGKRALFIRKRKQEKKQ